MISIIFFTITVINLAHIVDIDDSAGYPTLQSALELDSPSKQIQLLLGDTESKKHRVSYLKFREFLVRKLIPLGMEQIIQLPQYRGRIQELFTRRSHADELVHKNARLEGRVIVIDKSGEVSHASRWAPYQVFPEAPYSVQILDRGGEYKIGIGSNKWSKEKSRINLGEVARRYGGGGHKGISALFVKNKEEADRIAQEIIDFLNANHLIT